MKIFKYTVPVYDKTHTFEMAVGDVLHVACLPDVKDEVLFWAFAPKPLPGARVVNRSFRIFGTGQTVPDGWKYCGTTLAAERRLVWHLFEKL